MAFSAIACSEKHARAWRSRLGTRTIAEVYIYKTAHHPRLKTDYRKPALDAAMATAAAPTFFERHRTIDTVGLLDGGVWANNPIGVAAVEATTLLGWRGQDLRILSLGCGEEIYLFDDAAGFKDLRCRGPDAAFDGWPVPRCHGHCKADYRTSP